MSHLLLFHPRLLREEECDFHTQAEALLSTGLSCKWAIWFDLSLQLQRCVALFVSCIFSLFPNPPGNLLLTVWPLLFLSLWGYCVSVFRRRRPVGTGGGAGQNLPVRCIVALHTHAHLANYTHNDCVIDSRHIAKAWHLSPSHFLSLWATGSQQKLCFRSNIFSRKREDYIVYPGIGKCYWRDAVH